MEMTDVMQIDLENALQNATKHLPMYPRMVAIAKYGVADADEAKILIAALRDRYE